MNPEVPNSGTSADSFANMAASMPSYSEHMANQTGSVLEGPPANEPNPTDKPPAGEQTSADMQSEQDQNTTIKTDESAPTVNLAPKTTEAAAKSAAEKTAETSADFSPEELADIEKYADKLETDANADLEMANLLHQFVNVASHQRSANHQASAASTESTPPPGTPNAPSNSLEQPVTAPEPTIPDAATAIAEALAETSGTPIPGQNTIATPPEPPAGNFSGTSADANSLVA